MMGGGGVAVVEDVGFLGSAVKLTASGAGSGWKAATTKAESVDSTGKRSLAVEKKTSSSSSSLARLTGVSTRAKAEEAGEESSTGETVWTDDMWGMSPSLAAEKKGDENAEQTPL